MSACMCVRVCVCLCACGRACVYARMRGGGSDLVRSGGERGLAAAAAARGQQQQQQRQRRQRAARQPRLRGTHATQITSAHHNHMPTTIPGYATYIYASVYAKTLESAVLTLLHATQLRNVRKQFWSTHICAWAETVTSNSLTSHRAQWHFQYFVRSVLYIFTL